MHQCFFSAILCSTFALSVIFFFILLLSFIIFNATAAILLQAASPWLLNFTPLICCQLESCFPVSPLNSATTSPTAHSTCFWGRSERQRLFHSSKNNNTLSDSCSQGRPGFPSASSHFWFLSLCLCPGMTLNMLAMLLVSVIRGQVVAVYNIEKLDWAHKTTQSTSSPQTASRQGTVLT